MSEIMIHAPSQVSSDGAPQAILFGRIADLYRDGRTRKAISEELGCALSTVSRALNAEGVQLRQDRRRERLEALVERIKELCKFGLSNVEIGTMLGVSSGSVAGLIFRNGITRPVRKPAASRRRTATPKAKADPKPKLVAVPSRYGERAILVAAADAQKFADRAPESTPMVCTAADDPIMSLGILSCRWPIGEVGHAGFRFCCAPATVAYKEDALPKYCSEHGRKAYQRTSKKTREVHERPELRAKVPMDFRRWS